MKPGFVFKAIAVALCLHTAAVVADTTALGSTARGATSQMGRTLATIVSARGPTPMRPQELANTADYIPLVNAGEMDFGIANVVQVTHAVNGIGMSAGRPNPNLRVVARLTPFRNAYIVREDSNIRTVADLAGRRVPVFAAQTLGGYVTRGFFANAGMTLNDVEGVVVPNFTRMWSSFAEGSTDVTIVAVGAGNTREFDASFGIRYLSFDESPEALMRMREWLPRNYLQEMPPGSVPGMDARTIVNAFDYLLFAGRDVDEAVVYGTVKTLWEREQSLIAAGPLWAGFRKENMGKDLGLAFHPGAIRFYRQMGVWEQGPDPATSP